MKRNRFQDTPLSKRKSEHLQIVANEDIVHSGGTLLGDIKLMHRAVPELDLGDIDTSAVFFGKTLEFPFMITGMTGGAEYAGKLNHALAGLCQKYGIALGVGSQRVMIHHPEVARDFMVRAEIPDGVLLGNIGAVQLQEHSSAIIRDLVNIIEADGICVHLNAAQELIQVEGHRNFKGILNKIGELVEYLDGRVLVKETGAGMSAETFRQLKSTGVRYIDVSGAGGTSWTKVEACRAEDEKLKKLGHAFGDWGVPTAFSIITGRKILGESVCLVGSGGILSGLDAARAIAAGADIAGFARPALMAFLKNGARGVASLIENFALELKTVMLLTGSQNMSALKKTPRMYAGELKDWLEHIEL